MIKSLRKRFIKVTSIALLGMLILLMVGINGIYMYKSEKNLSNVLKVIIENEGVFPERFDKSYSNNNDNKINDYREYVFDKIDNGNREMFFTTRFCVVNLDNKKNIINIDSEKISAISDEEIEVYTENILSKNKDKGWINDYKYVITETTDGYMLIMLDGSLLKQSIVNVLTSSIAVAFIGYIIIIFIIALASKRAVRPVAESYEKQRQFITDASHELKTPLTIISANSEILSMLYGEDEWIEGIEKQTEKMRDLVNNLVLLTKMDEENQEIIYEEFNFSDATYDTVMAFEGLCKKNRKKLNCDIKTDIFLKGNESAIRQLIAILIDNAVKYCDEQGEIFVSLKEEKQIILSVTNTYGAVSNISLDNVFERFYREDKARTRNGSYGLGLAIGKAIVEKHKGKIKASNIDNSKILFEVKLPI